MDKQDIDRIVREELLHISFNTANPWQRMFRMMYNMVRRQDLAQDPAADRGASLLRCVEDLRESSPDFNPIDLDYDTTYFGPMAPEWLNSGEGNHKERILLITEREHILRNWNTFARENDLDLAWFTDLTLRAECVVQVSGACPCLPDERPACPCEEVMSECREQGQCHCRVFLAKDFKARVPARA